MVVASAANPVSRLITHRQPCPQRAANAGLCASIGIEGPAILSSPSKPLALRPAKRGRTTRQRSKLTMKKMIVSMLLFHYMDTLEFHAISGHDMIQKFGYRECPK